MGLYRSREHHKTEKKNDRMLTWGCYPLPIYATGMGRKNLWMPRKLSKDETDSEVCLGEIFWNGRRVNACVSPLSSDF